MSDPEEASMFHSWWIDHYETADTLSRNNPHWNEDPQFQALMSISAILAALNANLERLVDSYNGWKDMES